jgi:hypothetical protein
MKKTILNAALLMAATLSVPLAANAVTLTYSYDDVANFLHFQGTFEGALASDNNTFVVDSTSPGTGGYLDSLTTFQVWSLDTVFSFDNLVLRTVALPTVTLDGTYMDIFAIEGLSKDRQWSASVGNGFAALTQSGPRVSLGKSYSDFSAANWTASVSPPVSPVPEPETYALMLAGLGVVGFMARRRKAK